MKRFDLVAVVAAGSLVLFVVGSLVYTWWRPCLGEERAALMEFPHYGSTEKKSGPYPQLLAHECEVTYTTKDSWKEVLGHYDEHLRQHGWKVETRAAFGAIYYPEGVEDPGGKERPKIVRGKRLSDLSEVPEDLPEVSVPDDETQQVDLYASRDGYMYSVLYLPPNKQVPSIPDDKALVSVGVDYVGPGG